MEIDGAYVGGFQRQENRRQDRGNRRAVEHAHPAGRQVVTVLRQRPIADLPDRVFVTVTLGETAAYAEDIGLRKLTRRTIAMTDEHGAYAGLGRLQALAIRIRHADAYVMGPGLNTTLAESFFSRMRRAAIGIYHRICGTYLELYVWSFAWHENTRRMGFSDKFRFVLQAGLSHGVSRKFCGYWQGVYPVEPLGWRLGRV